ncbi:hypothetical protein [Burkholderia sp. BCC0397]|uniref:hypothetical protein n=1 Tax=Burkholderia sp. BCC0397 TaxID=486876 RepID=UPI00158E6684|nr:hypothetical protein [Burkholderia sp. BCC0397]
MVKFKTWFQFLIIAIFAVAMVSFVRSCQADPTQGQLFDQLAMMRDDMRAIINDGGRVVRYDNNEKTTFARVYLLLSVDRKTWGVDLERAYGNTLLARGWVPVKKEANELSLCKGGAFASVTAPTADRNGSIAMIFDAASISKCQRLLRTGEAR